ncbi:S1 family peptidase [Saccharothrix obliqua]|uniref:S1 family peptidase n=1 Tax=Saccharothrix obliqua TaxID=2861747 RepID=UPI001C5F3E72|nr:S1 family peptidase [Saccharothrix obliqua]MBW4718123.1 S1 family peptidase [Saccharothrix obliqua]
MAEAVRTGLGLTGGEAAELFERQSRAGGIAARLPRGGVAGHWLDDGRLKVAVTDQGTAEVVRSLGAEPERVRRGREELEALLRWVEENATEAVVSWGIDPTKNAVVAVVDPAAGPGLPARDGVEVVEGEPGEFAQGDGGESWDWDDDGVVEVGLKDEQKVRPGGGWRERPFADCTIGFPVRDGTGSGHFLTAAHCMSEEEQRASVHTKNMGWQVVGKSNPGGHRRVFGEEGDFGLVSVADESEWDLSLRVETGRGGPEVEVDGHLSPIQGQAICFAGRVSGWNCGKVTGTDRSGRFGKEKTLLAGLFGTDMCVRKGDSGGPGISGRKGVGTVVGGNSRCDSGKPDRSYFTPLDRSLEKWGLKLVGAR